MNHCDTCEYWKDARKRFGDFNREIPLKIGTCENVGNYRFRDLVTKKFEPLENFGCPFWNQKSEPKTSS